MRVWRLVLLSSAVLLWLGPVLSQAQPVVSRAPVWFPRADCEEVTALGQCCVDIEGLDRGQQCCGDGESCLVEPTAITVSLQASKDAGNVIANATPISPVTIGDGLTSWEMYADPVSGPVLVAKDQSGNKVTTGTRFWTAGTVGFFFLTDGSTCISVNGTTGVWTYANAQSCRPRKSIWIDAGGMSVSGTCTDTAPTERTLITNGPKRYTIQPADNDTCSVEFDVVMPDAWDGGTVTITLVVHSTQNNNTERLEMHFAGRCVRSGDAVAAHATTNEQAATITFGSQAHDERQATTPAITLQGTCAAGAHVYFRGQVNANDGATPTNISPVTDANILGAKLEFAVSSNTD